MYLHFSILPFLLLPFLSSPLPLSRRDADFGTVSTGLLANSFHDVDPTSPSFSPSKYFHEATFGGHYDGRFAAGRLNRIERRAALTPLIRAYLAFMTSIGVETWLAHGTLLGWWWNRRVLPWDSDVDVMVSEKGILFLKAGYNMTVHTFAFPAEGPGEAEEVRSYLLEVNPHCVDGSRDGENMIDARWIDRGNGLFIDITTVRRNRTAVRDGDREAVMVKDGHHYRYDEIWPLRETVFEGVPARVPFAYPELLVEEYGDAALSMSNFMQHHFNEGMQRWVTPDEDWDERDHGTGGKGDGEGSRKMFGWLWGKG